MRIGVSVFRAVLAAAWLWLLVVTLHAAKAMGWGAALSTFVADFAHPWRAQFDTDFTYHILLVAAWMVWRAQRWWVGLICAVLAFNLGSMFTLAYLLVASFQTEGDFRKLMLGARAG